MVLNEEDLERFKKYLKAARTLSELEQEIGISRRTVFRYLTILKNRGCNVIRDGLTRPTKYRILTLRDAARA